MKQSIFRLFLKPSPFFDEYRDEDNIHKEVTNMKKLTTLLLALLMVLTLLTGCGGASVSAPSMKGDYAVREEAMEAPAATEVGNSMLTDSSSGESGAVPENRKWIITVHMEAETEDLDPMIAELDQHITALNGYVENQEVYNGSPSSTYRRRNTYLTIRIPAGDVDAFTQKIEGISNVISKNLTREDITLSYTATESKINALKTEEARLLELLAKAENMSDLLEIEARLSDVRYELERYSSQLRLYDNQVDYATIHLTIREVKEYTPVAEKTVWERIRDGFSDSLEGLWEGIVDLFVWIIVSSPYLLVYGILITVICVVVRKIRKKRKAKKNLPQQENNQ